MTYQQAGRIATIKRISGWVVFIPALLSTLVSLINFVHWYSGKSKTISAVIRDLVNLMIDVTRFNTGFLNMFWHYSPVPDADRLFSVANFMFLIIYLLIFIGAALQITGARMARQLERIREGIEDQIILEQAKGNESDDVREQLEERMVLPHHSIFSQYFTLYILPVVCGIVIYLILDFSGLLGK